MIDFSSYWLQNHIFWIVNHVFNLFYTFSFLNTNQHILQESFKRPGWSFVVNWLLKPLSTDSQKELVDEQCCDIVLKLLWITLLETYFQLNTLQSLGVRRKLLKSSAFILAQTLLHNLIRLSMFVVTLLGRLMDAAAFSAA